MTDRLADTALRLLAPRARAEGFGDHDSLQNVNTFELPNGSLCWVIATEGLYRLDKLDNTTPAVVGVVIIPLAGPGRWILLQSGSGSTILGVEIFLTATSILDPSLPITPAGALVWTAGPVGMAPIYTVVPAAPPLFTADLLTGILTYNGPARRYLLEVYASVSIPQFSGVATIGLTSNATSSPRLGLMTDDGTAAVEEITLPPNDTISMAAARSVDLAPADTCQAVLADILAEAAATMLVRRLHLVATPFE